MAGRSPSQNSLLVKRARMSYHEPRAFQLKIRSEDGGKTNVKRVLAFPLPAILLLVVHIVVLTLLALPSLAWQNNEESATPEEHHGYPVVVDGYEIFQVHQNLGAAAAPERARRISAALEQLATAEDFDPKAIQATEENGVTTVRYRDQLIVTINDAEAHGTGLPREALAKQYAALLQEKLPMAREEHSARYLWRAAAYAAVTILIYMAVVWLIAAGSRRLLRIIETSAKARIHSIKIQQSEIVKGDRLARLLAGATRLGRAVLIADPHLRGAGEVVQLLSLDTGTRPAAAGLHRGPPDRDRAGFLGIPT